MSLTACSQEPAQEAPKAEAQTASFYRSDIAPLLTSRCATCHLTGQEAGNMSLIPDKAIASLVGVKSVEAPSLDRVVPGKPDDSYLIMKLENTHSEHGGTGAQMPFGAPPLSKEDITKIRKWISEGAKE
jgi:mono/diheme cytochrome c family protein